MTYFSKSTAQVLQPTIFALGLFATLTGLLVNTSLLLVTCVSIFAYAIVHLNTPSLKTSELMAQQSALPGKELISAIKTTLPAKTTESKTSTDIVVFNPFYYSVKQYYLSNDLPFPIGLAYQELTESRKKNIKLITDTKNVINIWHSKPNDQDATWLKIQADAESSLENINRILDILQIHPEFHQHYQSMQTYNAANYAKDASVAAKNAESSANSAEFWSFLSFFSK
jgi:hypothetical protein